MAYRARLLIHRTYFHRFAFIAPPDFALTLDDGKACLVNPSFECHADRAAGVGSTATGRAGKIFAFVDDGEL